MTPRLFLLIVVSVSISAFAQLAFKLGMSTPAIQTVLRDGSRLDAGWTIATNGYVILGLLLYGLGAFLWLLVLARLDVSMAYPFVGLGMIVTMLLGYFVLSEPVNSVRVIGTLLVVSGVVLISRS